MQWVPRNFLTHVPDYTASGPSLLILIRHLDHRGLVVSTTEYSVFKFGHGN